MSLPRWQVDELAAFLYASKTNKRGTWQQQPLTIKAFYRRMAKAALTYIHTNAWEKPL